MARVPCLEHVQRFAPANFADDDAVRPKPERRAHQVRHRRDAGTGTQRHAVRRRALELARILDEDHPLVLRRELGEKRVGEGRLARAGPAGDQDVAALYDRERQQARRLGGHDAVLHIVGERVDPRGWLADREARRGGDRGQDTFEPLSSHAFGVRRQLGADDRRGAVYLGAGVARHQPDDPLDLRRIQHLAGIAASLAQPVEAQGTVGIDHDLDDVRLGEGGGDRRPHGGAEHRALASGGLDCAHRAPPARGSG